MQKAGPTKMLRLSEQHLGPEDQHRSLEDTAPGDDVEDDGRRTRRVRVGHGQRDARHEQDDWKDGEGNGSCLLFQSFQHGDEVLSVDEDGNSAQQQNGAEDFRQQQGGCHGLAVLRREIG